MVISLFSSMFKYAIVCYPPTKGWPVVQVCQVLSITNFIMLIQLFISDKRLFTTWTSLIEHKRNRFHVVTDVISPPRVFPQYKRLCTTCRDAYTIWKLNIKTVFRCTLVSMKRMAVVKLRSAVDPKENTLSTSRHRIRSRYTLYQTHQVNLSTSWSNMKVRI